ncbi:MAG: Holliday junction branch migration DNA helicase RuvB [Cyanobacteria bacterium]|nr:Holliday junction branch migration DNA helicase RuvB [Cyanobacteriota bacterium]
MSFDKRVKRPLVGLSSAQKPEPSTLLKKEETEYDQRLEQRIRPKTLEEYVGQSALKTSLKISIDAAKQRQEPLEHLLLYGPPGLGKTTLAMILAEEMGAQIHITAAPALERPRDIIGILMSLSPGDVLFIDEIHRLNKVTEEILYPAMEDFTVDRTLGKGHSTKILRVPIPAFTLIGATTKAGAIANPMRDRFGLSYRLNFYQEDELESILNRSAGILSIGLAPSAAAALAGRSRGTPRIANRLLRRVRDYVQVTFEKADLITSEGAEAALTLFEVDEKGLEQTDRQLLTILAEQFNGGPAGLETLATILGEDAKTLEDVYEPYLMQAGLLQRTPRGRMITPAGLKHLLLEAQTHLL